MYCTRRPCKFDLGQSSAVGDDPDFAIAAKEGADELGLLFDDMEGTVFDPIAEATSIRLRFFGLSCSSEPARRPCLGFARP